MSKVLTGVISGLFLTQAAVAEPPAVYRDLVIHIPGGAVIDEAGTAYYQNVLLENDGTGVFRIIAAERRELAVVETAEVVPGTEEGTYEVVVTGTQTPCVETLEPAVSLQDEEFTVVLPVSEPEEDCDLEPEAYQFTFPLDVTDVEPGLYTVVVNEVETEFELVEVVPEDGMEGAPGGGGDDEGGGEDDGDGEEAGEDGGEDDGDGEEAGEDGGEDDGDGEGAGEDGGEGGGEASGDDGGFTGFTGD